MNKAILYKAIWGHWDEDKGCMVGGMDARLHSIIHTDGDCLDKLTRKQRYEYQ